jgi:hypothetical protein
MAYFNAIEKCRMVLSKKKENCREAIVTVRVVDTEEL